MNTGDLFAADDRKIAEILRLCARAVDQKIGPEQLLREMDIEFDYATLLHIGADRLLKSGVSS